MNASSRIPDRHARSYPTDVESGAGRNASPPGLNLAALALLGFALAACTPEGDFGRVTPSFAIQAVAGEPIAQPDSRALPLTDDEAELRQRAYRFLVQRADPPAAYYATLVDAEFRSPASRFFTVAGDATADHLLISPFADNARRVYAADRARLAGMAYVNDLTPPEVSAVALRVRENRCLVARVRSAAYERLVAYRYAVEHGFLAMPQLQAIEAERSINALEIAVTELDELSAAQWRGGNCIEAGKVHVKRKRRALVTKD
jgi:hypothetical protein